MNRLLTACLLIVMSQSMSFAVETIDVMVLHSKDFDPSMAQNRAKECVEYANKALADSAVKNVVLRLVYCGGIDHESSGNIFADLRVIRTESDARGVSAIRSRFGADIVCLFTLRSGSLSGATFTGEPHMVVCGGEPSVFAHELGHSFGCEHNVSLVDGLPLIMHPDFSPRMIARYSSDEAALITRNADRLIALSPQQISIAVESGSVTVKHPKPYALQHSANFHSWATIGTNVAAYRITVSPSFFRVIRL